MGGMLLSVSLVILRKRRQDGQVMKSQHDGTSMGIRAGLPHWGAVRAKDVLRFGQSQKDLLRSLQNSSARRTTGSLPLLQPKARGHRSQSLCMCSVGGVKTCLQGRGKTRHPAQHWREAQSDCLERIYGVSMQCDSSCVTAATWPVLISKNSFTQLQEILFMCVQASSPPPRINQL